MKKSVFLCIMIFFASSIFAQDALHDIRPPVALPEHHVWLFILLIILFIFFVFFILRYYRGKKPQTQKPVIIKKPWDVALERLESLLNKNFIAHGKVKEFYIEIGDIVRHYIEERFLWKAPEMTTSEFLEYIKQQGHLNIDHKSLLKDFLNCCDMVKFAQYGPTEKEIEDSVVAAKRFIEETIIKEEMIKNP